MSDPQALATVIERLQRGDAASAEPLARMARAERPADAECARLHGIALLMLARNADARAAFEAALAIDPANAAAASNLAAALLALGDADGAVRHLEGVVQRHADDPALRNNFANALRAAGNDARARDEYLAALRLAPDDTSASLNLAAVDIALGHASEAEARLRALLARQPHPQGWLLLGHALNAQRRFADAKAAYEAGGELAPRAAEFPYQAGLMADELHHYAEAAHCYQMALRLDPQLTLAEGQLLFVLRRECAWAAAAPLAARVKARALDGSGSIDPFAFLAEDASPAEQLACAKARAARLAHDKAALLQHAGFEYAPRAAGRALRVGFVSAGFHAHATALLAVDMLEHLGRRDDIELHLYASTPDDGSEVRRRLRGAAHGFHEIAQQPARNVANAIHAAGIDVLIDVDGWCAGGMPELFALRPAPAQAAWLAYPGSAGMPWIDYLIADRFLIPESAQTFYSEAIAYLPRCYQPSDTTRPLHDAPPRADFGLPDGAIVFASFNNTWKLNAASFARMCAVLRGVPDGVLWLLAGGREVEARLRAAAHGHGIDPRRLVFSPALPHLEHLARYRLADLFLDTHPYNAHTTASDALWGGCPVLTCPGATFASRVAGSLNHHLGMPELNAASDADFVAAAVRLGNDRAALAGLRERLMARRAASGLFNMAAYADDFAALLQELATRRAHGLPPQSFVLDSAAPTQALP